MILHQMFRVTGVANQTILDTGLKSTPSEPKKIRQIHIQCDKYAATDDNQVVGFLETTKVFEFPEKQFETELFSNVAQSVSGHKEKTIEVDHVIEPGETFKIGNTCAATAVNIRGSYEYEIVK